MDNEYYEVCGREWFNDVMKLKKSIIVELYKKALQKEITTKDQSGQNQVERQGYVPEWWPADPYPVKLCSIKNDDDLAKAIPDPKTRAAVAWYLMGEAYQRTTRRVLEALKEHLDLGT